MLKNTFLILAITASAAIAQNGSTITFTGFQDGGIVMGTGTSPAWDPTDTYYAGWNLQGLQGCDPINTPNQNASITCSVSIVATAPGQGALLDIQALYGTAEGLSDLGSETRTTSGIWLNSPWNTQMQYSAKFESLRLVPCQTTYVRILYSAPWGSDSKDIRIPVACGVNIGFSHAPTENLQPGTPIHVTAGVQGNYFSTYPTSITYQANYATAGGNGDQSGFTIPMNNAPFFQQLGWDTTDFSIPWDAPCPGTITYLPTSYNMYPAPTPGFTFNLCQNWNGSPPMTFSVNDPVPGPIDAGSTTFNCGSNTSPVSVTFRHRPVGYGGTCNPAKTSVCDPIAGVPDTKIYPVYNGATSMPWNVTANLPACLHVVMTIANYDGSMGKDFDFKTFCPKAKRYTTASVQNLPTICSINQFGLWNDPMCPFPTPDGQPYNPEAIELSQPSTGWDIAYNATGHANVTASSTIAGSSPDFVTRGDPGGSLVAGNKAWLSQAPGLGQSALDLASRSYWQIDLGPNPSRVASITIYPFLDPGCYNGTPTCTPDYMYLTDYWIFMSSYPFPPDPTGTPEWIVANQPGILAFHRTTTANQNVLLSGQPWDIIDFRDDYASALAVRYVRIQRTPGMNGGTQLGLGMVVIDGFLGTPKTTEETPVGIGTDSLKHTSGKNQDLVSPMQTLDEYQASVAKTITDLKQIKFTPEQQKLIDHIKANPQLWAPPKKGERKVMQWNHEWDAKGGTTSQQ